MRRPHNPSADCSFGEAKCNISEGICLPIDGVLLIELDSTVDLGDRPATVAVRQEVDTDECGAGRVRRGECQRGSLGRRSYTLALGSERDVRSPLPRRSDPAG